MSSVESWTKYKNKKAYMYIVKFLIESSWVELNKLLKPWLNQPDFIVLIFYMVKLEIQF
jgi:hypothetical protein